jgi:hypothetical protein
MGGPKAKARTRVVRIRSPLRLSIQPRSPTRTPEDGKRAPEVNNPAPTLNPDTIPTNILAPSPNGGAGIRDEEGEEGKAEGEEIDSLVSSIQSFGEANPTNMNSRTIRITPGKSLLQRNNTYGYETLLELPEGTDYMYGRQPAESLHDPRRKQRRCGRTGEWAR